MTEPTQLTEDEIKRFREMESENKKLRKAHEAAEEQAKLSKTAAEQAQADALAAAERVTALEVENRRRTFAEQAKDWHGDTPKHVTILESLPTDELRTAYAEQQAAASTALTEALTQAKAFSRVGVTGGIEADSAMGRLEAKAKEKMAADPKLNHAVAFAEATRENPDLYLQYVEETRGAVN